jgi:lipopolysaccharide assembly outer membrane protein LptD (OstA)
LRARATGLLLLLALPWAAPPGAGAQPPEEPSAPAASAPASSEAEDLVQATLGEDIATAGYYELIAWCRELELADTGSSQDLRARLYAHFHIQPPPGPEKAPRRVLEIKSARATEYFTVEPINENEVLLQGDVVVELREQDVVHRIKAQKVVLNQSANLLTAEGGLEYTFKRGDREDVFHGDRLTFDVESWEGAFFGGGMEGDRDVSGKKVRFRFEADSISKLRGNSVVLDHGTITSCDLPTDPHYHISARKIWVLAPGEWAIASAVLYIGRVPVMYLPFFFRPGDEFFFHPSVGFRDREGTFVQTTTYLIGQKPRTPSALSVLAATEEQGQQYRREIQGLFLRLPEGEQVPVTDNRFLKVFLDYYTRLGAFAGVSGSFPPKVSFRSGLGVSRNIYYSGQYGYSPWDAAGGSYESVWNKSSLFGLQLPFRYGLDGKWDLSGPQAKLSGKFEYYSDPFFAKDFYNRSEEVGLTRLLGMEGAQAQTQTEGEKRALGWELNSQVEFKTGGLGSHLKKLSVPYLNANLYWQSILPTVIPEDKDLVDPTVYFYYPVSLKLPNAALQVSGDLLTLPATGVSSAPPQPAAAPSEGASAPPAAGPQTPPVPLDLRLPAGVPLPAAQEGASLPERAPAPPERAPAPARLPSAPASGAGAAAVLRPGELRRPRPREKLPDLPAPVPVSFSLTYQARPALAVEQSFHLDPSWSVPSDVTYGLDYSSLESSGVGSLDWALKVYESLFSLNGSLGLSGSYRTKHRLLYADDTSWQNLVLSDYRYSQLQVKNLLAMSLSPFYNNQQFKATRFSYSVSWLPFRYTLDETASSYGSPVYIGQAPGWNAATFSQHQAEAVFGWQPGQQLSSLSVSAQLPPLSPSMTAKVDAAVWLLRTAVTSVFRESDRFWNLAVVESFQPSAKFRLSEELQADLNERQWTRSVSTLTWGGFSSSLTAQQLFPGEPMQWANVSAGLKLTPASFYFWKNRSRLETTINTSWSMDLYPTNISGFDVYTNNLTFSFTLKYFLYKFLEFSLTTSSYNNNTFQYFHKLAYSYRDPITDLLKSFNFFNTKDREFSYFKLKSIVLDMVHHMHDWDLTLRYEGKPLLQTVLGKPVYTWNNSFSILLQWTPIPELRSNLHGDSQNGFFLRD